MAKEAFRLRIKKGMNDEYKRRHDMIWPGMLDLMKEMGVRNYSIWNAGQDIFGYYEVDDPEKAKEIAGKSKVAVKWAEYMSDVMDDVLSDEGTEMKLMFLFE